MKTIALCMIVKNESHVIERCIKSVRPLIDYVFIVDTGSTDNTIDVINKSIIDFLCKQSTTNHICNKTTNQTVNIKKCFTIEHQK